MCPFFHGVCGQRGWALALTDAHLSFCVVSGWPDVQAQASEEEDPGGQEQPGGDRVQAQGGAQAHIRLEQRDRAAVKLFQVRGH